MKDLKSKKSPAGKPSTITSASSFAAQSNQLRDSPNAENLQPSSPGINTPSNRIIVHSNKLLSTSANIAKLHQSSGNTTPSRPIGQPNQCLQSSFPPTTKIMAPSNFGASNPLGKPRNPSIIPEEAIQSATMLYALPNGQLVGANQLIAGDNGDDTLENDADATLSTIVHDYAANATSGTPNDATDIQSSLLLNIALKIIKIEENQKAAEKRLANLEKGIGMILNVLSIDESDGKWKGTPIYNQGSDTQFKKITTVDELKAFEDKLKDPKFHAEKVK